MNSQDQETRKQKVSHTQTHDFIPGSCVGHEESHKYVWEWCGGECPTKYNWPKQQVTRALRKLWTEGNGVLQKQPHKQKWKAAAGPISSGYYVNLVYIEMT